MDIKDKEAIALWKYSYIAPAITGNHGFPSSSAYFDHVSEVPLTNPVTGKSKVYSSNTLKYWLFEFSRGGIHALMPSTRKDFRTSRRLTLQAQREIIDLLTTFGRAPNTVIRVKLLESGAIDASVSQSTIDRFIKITLENYKLPEIHQGKDRKAYEFEHINQCWQADTTFLKSINGKKVCLMLIVDDASRMVVGWGVFFEDNAVNFLKVLKKAISIYGRPALLYMDNGAPYKNQHLDWSCAQLNVATAHTPVRDGAAKGKTERLNRTLKDRWLRSIDWSEFETLEDVSKSFQKYLTTDYLVSPHSSLKDSNGNLISPRDRFMSESQIIKRVSPELLDQSFLYHDTRKVKSDSTVRIQNISFDIPSEYMAETIEIFYDPLSLDFIWFQTNESRERQKAFRTNKVENSKTVRKQHISYHKEDH